MKPRRAAALALVSALFLVGCDQRVECSPDGRVLKYECRLNSLNDLAGGEIRATATALLSAALDHTTRDLEMKLTRQRVAQVQTALEQFSANFSTRTEAELERFVLRAKAQLEELSGRIESALGKLAAGERRVAELLSVRGSLFGGADPRGDGKSS